jgi:CRP/FNR family cyclic AMP-dependent transcriptional regulator
MNRKALSLSTFPVLAQVDGQAQQAVTDHAHEHRYCAGQMIALEGDPSQAVYLVAEGRLQSRRFSVEGREYVLHDLGPGEWVNLASVLDGGYNLATVTAVSDAVLYAIPAADLRRILSEHPALALALLSHLTRRVRHLSDAVEGLALYDVRIRLARCLLAYTLRARENEPAREEDWPCPPYLTQGELAALIGTVRDVVGRTLRSFTREGLIRRERGRVVITDLAGLRREALLQQPARLAS